MIYICFQNISHKTVALITDYKINRNVITVEQSEVKNGKFIVSLLNRYKEIIITGSKVPLSDIRLGPGHINDFSQYTHINKSYLSFWRENLEELSEISDLNDILASLRTK